MSFLIYAEVNDKNEIVFEWDNSKSISQDVINNIKVKYGDLVFNYTKRKFREKKKGFLL